MREGDAEHVWSGLEGVPTTQQPRAHALRKVGKPLKLEVVRKIDRDERPATANLQEIVVLVEDEPSLAIVKYARVQVPEHVLAHFGRLRKQLERRQCIETT